MKGTVCATTVSYFSESDAGITFMPALEPNVVYVACDAEEAEWTEELIQKLRPAFSRILGDRLDEADFPIVKLVKGFENIPSSNALGALSILLVVLPEGSRGFGAKGTAQLQEIIAKSDPQGLEARILPLAPKKERLPPAAPLHRLVGMSADDLSDDKVNEIATCVLINTALTVSSRKRSVFISYRQWDGTAVAERLAQRLKERGLFVWRDRERDPDHMTLITPGSDAQKTIEQAILQQSLVLLIDSPSAPKSYWVREEVGMSFGYLLPILPIVIEDEKGTENPVPPKGGRFLEVRSMGKEVRLSSAALGDATHQTADELVDEKIDEIERLIIDILVGHLRSRRRLVEDSERRFIEQEFSWADWETISDLARAQGITNVRLLFKAEKSGISRVKKRYLVRCSPYGVLIKNTVQGLTDTFRKSATDGWPFQYALLIHNALAYEDDIASVVDPSCADYVIVLRPYEIAANNLP